ncbi:MAG: threonine/serine exporter family protein [Clostridia bacterium]|nr:threonine/serine exporter family protein [Clostridia bacterium]
MENENKNLIDADRVMRLAGEMGVRLIKNGAEIYRVEESLIIICESYGMEKVKIFALPTLIILRFEQNGTVYTDQFRLHSDTVNLDRLEKLNNLCRDIKDHLSIDEAEKTLAEIIGTKKYPTLISYIAYGFVGMFYTLFWGGRWIDALLGFVCAVVVRAVVLFAKKFKTNVLFKNILAGFFLGLLPYLSALLISGVMIDKIIIGVIMLLVPGIGIANVMRDILAGDTYTALLRFTNILIIGIGLAIGISVSLAFLPKVIAAGGAL